MDNWLGNRNSA